jgi:hypothetical protein
MSNYSSWFGVYETILSFQIQAEGNRIRAFLLSRVPPNSTLADIIGEMSDEELIAEESYMRKQKILHPERKKR